MPCPTCDHTMHNIGAFPEDKEGKNKIFWCPRCGSLKSVFGDHEEVSNTIWTKNIITASRFDKPKQNTSQQTVIKVNFNVKQIDLNSIQLEMFIQK